MRRSRPSGQPTAAMTKSSPAWQATWSPTRGDAGALRRRWRRAGPSSPRSTGCRRGRPGGGTGPCRCRRRAAACRRSARRRGRPAAPTWARRLDHQRRPAGCGRPGKCPAKNGSSPVSRHDADARSPGTTSCTSVTKRNGSPVRQQVGRDDVAHDCGSRHTAMRLGPPASGISPESHEAEPSVERPVAGVRGVQVGAHALGVAPLEHRGDHHGAEALPLPGRRRCRGR